MAITMTITTAGDGRWRAALAEAARRGEDMTPLMDAIGMGLEASTVERFNETSRAPDGTPWKPSIAADEGRRTLVQRGHLRDSITHRAGPRSVRVGTNVLYAAVHQLGAVIRAKTARGLVFRIGREWRRVREVRIPARPFLGVSAEDEEMILAEATDWLAGAFGAGG